MSALAAGLIGVGFGFMLAIVAFAAWVLVSEPLMPTRPQQHQPRGRSAQALGGPVVNRQATRALHTGSPRWLAQRKRVLVRDLYICKACGNFGDEVDHIHNDAHQFVTDDRLQTLCRSCHSAKTRAEQNR